MKVVKSLLHKITNQTEVFNATLDIHNDALSFIIRVIDKEFDNTDDLTTKSIVSAVEKLIHVTKSNPLPKYKEFDECFYKFPSYFRRSAIASAFDKVKSFRSNYQNWEKEQKYALSEGKRFNGKTHSSRRLMAHGIWNPTALAVGVSIVFRLD